MVFLLVLSFDFEKISLMQMLIAIAIVGINFKQILSSVKLCLNPCKIAFFGIM